jgi:hypothetical protein
MSLYERIKNYFRIPDPPQDPPAGSSRCVRGSAGGLGRSRSCTASSHETFAADNAVDNSNHEDFLKRRETGKGRTA